MNVDASSPLTSAERKHLQRLMVYLTDRKDLWRMHGWDASTKTLDTPYKDKHLRLSLRYSTKNGRVAVFDGARHSNIAIAEVTPGAGVTDEETGRLLLKSWIVESWPKDAEMERLVYDFVVGIDPLLSMAAADR